MKVFLNSNFEIENISNESGDPIVRGSDKFNKLHIFVPTNTVNSYNTISPLYSVKRADGRILGNYATITTHDNTEAFNGYYGWKGDFNPRDIAVAGALELTISFKMKKTAASVEMTKTIAKITLEVKEAAVVLDDVLVLGDGDVWISMSESIAALQNNLSGKADKTNTQQEITAAKFTASSFKKGDAELATEAQVSEEATARQQADNALQTDINTRVKIADIINALNNTSTNKPLSAYQGKLLKDAIDRINTLLQSDDTNLDELQEIVTYIKNNKTLIDGITSSKISFSDIVDNLTSEVANKPLSAKQGYILKGFIDALQTAVNNRYTKSETDSLLDGKADKSTTYTKTQVNNLLSGKQDITIPTITIAGVEYTNLEAAISAINEYAKTIEQVIGSISGSDTTIATRLTQLESSVNSLNSAWQTFTTGTSADNIINTLVEIQNRFKDFNVIYLPDNATSGWLSNNIVNTITIQTLVVYEGKVFTLSEIGDDYYYFNSNSGDDTTCDIAYLYIENNPNNDEEQNYHIDFVSGEIKRNKVTSWSQNPSNENYPSEKLVKETIDKETAKSLYHLGAYDSADGKTRQTGYASINRNNTEYRSDIGIYLYRIDNFLAEELVGSIDLPYRLHYDADNSHWYSEGTNTYVIVIPSDIDKNIQIQYKLATSYTDTPIEGESILPLDSNMAQMIRQDVVDSLQEFDKNDPNMIYTTGYNGNISDTTGSDWVKVGLIKVLPNTTYATNITISRVGLYNGSTWTRLDNISTNTFTTANDTQYITLLRYLGGTQTADTSRTYWADLMLTKSNHAYPQGDYHANKHITDEEATLLKRETVKCRNLANYEARLVNKQIDGSNGAIRDYSGYYTILTEIKPNTTYTFSNRNESGLMVALYSGTPSSTTFISLEYATFTTPSNAKYVGFTLTNTSTQPMLNEGSEAKPYSENYGELVHKKDIEPVLLWENPSPTSAFTSQTITTKDMSAYKYIVFEYLISHTAGDGFAHTFQKFKRSSTVGEKYILSIASYGQGVAVICRDIENNSGNANQLHIMDGKYVDSSTNETNNDVCVPIAIYGTNIL